MVKPAPQLWLELNRTKYQCKACGYTTANKTHWERHKTSLKHFLLAELSPRCPRDCKIVIASFLPFTHLTKLGRIGIDAVKYAVKPTIKWYDHRQIYMYKKFTVRAPEDPPSRTVFLGVRRGHNLRSLAFAV